MNEQVQSQWTAAQRSQMVKRRDFCRWQLKTLEDVLAKTQIFSLSFHRSSSGPSWLYSLGCRSWCSNGVVFAGEIVASSGCGVTQSIPFLGEWWTHCLLQLGPSFPLGSAPSSGERGRRLSRPFLTWAGQGWEGRQHSCQLCSGFLPAAHCPRTQRAWEFKGGEKK